MSGEITKGAGYSCQYWNNLPREEQLKIFEAIDRLAKDNPEVSKHLMGLARLKEENPKKYKAGLKFLKLD